MKNVIVWFTQNLHLLKKVFPEDPWHVGFIVQQAGVQITLMLSAGQPGVQDTIVLSMGQPV